MKELIELYTKQLEYVKDPLFEYNKKAVGKHKATNPILLDIPEYCLTHEKRIMIFGQETNGWCRQCGENGSNEVFSNNLKKSMEIYRDFYWGEGIKKYRGPFWNEFKRIKNTFEKDSVTTIWNNINKIGTLTKGNVKEINEIQFKYFQVVKDEILLLKPQILVFFTGHDGVYNNFIEKNIGKFEEEPLDPNGDPNGNIKVLTFEDQNFNTLKAFKTFHPNALYFKGIRKEVIDTIMQAIQEALNIKK